jgi:hypothetical protein
VRDGKLKATRVGKSYRIARGDLESFAGGPIEPRQVSRQRRVDASTVVQIDALSPELAGRISTMITAATGAPIDVEQLHVQTIYDEERASMKIILAGGIGRMAGTLKLIEVLLES